MFRLRFALCSERKKNKGKKWDDMTEEYKDLLKTKGLASVFFMLWMFTGLLTFNWLIFLAIIIFNFTIIAPLGKLFKYSIGYTVLHWVNSLIGFTFGLFIIINSYHLKIDVYKWLIELINY